MDLAVWLCLGTWKAYKKASTWRRRHAAFLLYSGAKEIAMGEYEKRERNSHENGKFYVEFSRDIVYNKNISAFAPIRWKKLRLLFMKNSKPMRLLEYGIR